MTDSLKEVSKKKKHREELRANDQGKDSKNHVKGKMKLSDMETHEKAKW